MESGGSGGGPSGNPGMGLAGGMGMLKIQDDEMIPMQASNHSQMESGPQQRKEAKSDPMRPMQEEAPQPQQGTINQVVELSRQALLAWAREKYIDLSDPVNLAYMERALHALVEAQIQKAIQANVASHSSPSSSVGPLSNQSRQGTLLPQQPSRFTIQQRHVLKSKILPSKRLKSSLPQTQVAMGKEAASPPISTDAAHPLRLSKL